MTVPGLEAASQREPSALSPARIAPRDRADGLARALPTSSLINAVGSVGRTEEVLDHPVEQPCQRHPPAPRQALE
jgi:hypothetical protein